MEYQSLESSQLSDNLITLMIALQMLGAGLRLIDREHVWCVEDHGFRFTNISKGAKGKTRAKKLCLDKGHVRCLGLYAAKVCLPSEEEASLSGTTE